MYIYICIFGGAGPNFKKKQKTAPNWTPPPSPRNEIEAIEARRELHPKGFQLGSVALSPRCRQHLAARAIFPAPWFLMGPGVWVRDVNVPFLGTRNKCSNYRFRLDPPKTARPRKTLDHIPFFHPEEGGHCYVFKFALVFGYLRSFCGYLRSFCTSISARSFRKFND